MTYEEQFPALVFTLKEIAYDNGMVNRGESEEWTINTMFIRLKGKYLPSQIRELEMHLLKLSDQEKVTMATGEDKEVLTLLAFKGLPPSVNEMLNVAFDG